MIGSHCPIVFLTVLLMMATIAPMRADVFLSDARIRAIRERLGDPKSTQSAAWISAKAAAENALALDARVPKAWKVPRYYHDKAGHHLAKKPLEEDANAAYTLALAWRLTDDRRYADKAVEILMAWTRLQELDQGDDSALAFSYHYPAMIFAAGLLEKYEGWTMSEREAYRRWLIGRALPMNTMGKPNNWGNWGALLVISIGAFTGERELTGKAVQRLRALRDSQIDAAGHIPHEVTRQDGTGTHGVWYSHFTLKPQFLAMEVARLSGVDLWEEAPASGAGLRKAWETLAGWTMNPESFPYLTKDLDQLQHARVLRESPLAAARPGQNCAMDYFEIVAARWPINGMSEFLAPYRPMTGIHSAPWLTLTHGDLPGGL